MYLILIFCVKEVIHQLLSVDHGNTLWNPKMRGKILPKAKKGASVLSEIIISKCMYWKYTYMNNSFVLNAASDTGAYCFPKPKRCLRSFPGIENVDTVTNLQQIMNKIPEKKI